MRTYDLAGFLAFALLAWPSGLFPAEIHDAASEGNVAAVVTILENDSSQLEALDVRGRTPLHKAAMAGQLEVSRLLLDRGAAPDGVDSSGFTPLLLAIFTNNKQLVESLADHGADLNVEHPAYGSAIDLAFHMECQRGESGITSFFVSQGVAFDPNKIGPRGRTRFQVAIPFGRLGMVEYLIELGAHIDITDTRVGRTPLAEAVARGKENIVDFLLSHGADPNIPDNGGNPPIRFAVEKGMVGVLETLSANDVAIDFVDDRTGHTLLHLVAIKGHHGAAELLIANGADPTAEDKQGRTPLFYANKYGNRLLATLLTEHGAIAFDNAELEANRPVSLDAPLSDREAIAWYMNNRGWAIKTKSRLFLIDYEAFFQIPPTEPSLANGFVVLDEIRDQNVCVLYSCFHADEGELGLVHQIEDSLKRVTYIHNAADGWRDCQSAHYLNSYETVALGDLKVHSVRPTSADFMANLGFLIQVDGLEIFYTNFSTDNMEAYRECLDSLAGYTDRIDLALLPIPNPGEEDESDLRAFLEKFQPRAVALLDPDRRVQTFPQVATRIAEWGFDTEVFCTENPGDHFKYSPPNAD
jgi:ankyrin repeat protein